MFSPGLLQTILSRCGYDLCPCDNSDLFNAERLIKELQLKQNYESAFDDALFASLIPITNSLFAVGLVSLPGMITGQILFGVSPLIAPRYQIMVMAMIFGTSGISVILF